MESEGEDMSAEVVIFYFLIMAGIAEISSL